jgi:hypothetical protein
MTPRRQRAVTTMTPVNQKLEDCFVAVPPRHRAMVEQLHGLILSLYPGSRVDPTCCMPTCRVGDGWVAIANQKHDDSFYTCGAQHPANCRSACPAIHTGRRCVDFKPAAELPVAAVMQVIRHAIKHPQPA